MPGSDLPPLTANAALRWDALARLLPKRLGDVLEIGCGQGAMTARLAGRADSLLALEPDPQSFAVAAKRLSGIAEVRNAASDVLPSEARFDTVCAFEVLEHLEDDAAALQQWVERVRPGGMLVLSVPAHSDRMGLCDRLVGHFRRYDIDEMRGALAANGMRNADICLYGGPGGYALEGVREIIARRKLGKDNSDGYAERTASSGRFLQPAQGWQSRIVQAASLPAIAMQRLFPDRGPGLIAIARR